MSSQGTGTSGTLIVFLDGSLACFRNEVSSSRVTQGGDGRGNDSSFHGKTLGLWVVYCSKESGVVVDVEM